MNKEECQKTLTGEHLWFSEFICYEKMEYKKWGKSPWSGGFVGTPLTLKKCKACGMIDDLDYKKAKQ